MYGTGYLTIKTVRKISYNIHKIAIMFLKTILTIYSHFLKYFCFESLPVNSRDNQLHQVFRIQQDVLSVPSKQDEERQS